MHDALAGEVVQDGAEVQRQRQQLLEVGAVAADQRRQARAFDELEHEMRAHGVELGAEAAHEVGMREPAQHAPLAAHALERGRLEAGPQHLGDDERAQVLAVGDVGLVAVAAAEQPQGAQAGGDLLAGMDGGCGHGDHRPGRP